MDGVSLEALSERVRVLDERVGLLEDELEIRRLLAVWGPVSDSYSADVAAQIWDDHSIYDPGTVTAHGSDGIVSILNGKAHQDLLRNGVGHLISPPMVWLQGERATAICYHQLVLQETHPAPDDNGWTGGGNPFRIQRLFANRWEFVRGPEGWKISRRVTRALDGEPGEGRALFAQALAEDRTR